MRYNFASTVFLLVQLIEIMSALTVYINIEPQIVKIGDDLKVTCTVIGNAIDKGYQTLLTCPFNDKNTICISNCDSMDICLSKSCNRNMVGNQNFQCNRNESPTTLEYSYVFTSLSNASLHSWNHLLFACRFKGQMASGFANISKLISPTTISTNFKEDQISTANISFNIVRFRDYVLIGLIGGLLVSFLINVWCTVQWGIMKCKQRNKKRLKLQNINMQEENQQSDGKDLPFQKPYIDSLKKHDSQSSTLSNERSIPSKYVPYQSQTGSINCKPKYRIPAQVFDDYEMNRGSNHSLLGSMYGPMVFAPIQCIDPSMLPYMTPLSLSYNPSIHMNTDSNQSQNNLEIMSDQENQNPSMITQSVKELSEMTFDRNSNF